jgi:hypothetical protein
MHAQQKYLEFSFIKNRKRSVFNAQNKVKLSERYSVEKFINFMLYSICSNTVAWEINWTKNIENEIKFFFQYKNNSLLFKQN